MLICHLSLSPHTKKSLPSQNPILKNITDYLIEEVSAEEEELLGRSGETSEEPPKEGNPAEISVERDEKLVKVGACERANPRTAVGLSIRGTGQVLTFYLRGRRTQL